MSRPVLVVEDNMRNRKLLRKILRFRGLEVIECDDGATALELAKRHQPLLVLMDIELPTVDGISALRNLRGDPQTRAIPVVAVTASVTPGARDRVMAAGFDAYVAKPIDVEAFGRLIDKFIGEAPAT